jgi:hypothetical protein
MVSAQIGLRKGAESGFLLQPGMLSDVRDGLKDGKTRSEHMSSGLPPISDISEGGWHVSFVPIGDIGRGLFDHFIRAGE